MQAVRAAEGERLTAALSQALATGDRPLRLGILAELGDLADWDALLPGVAKLLHSRDPELRRAAQLALHRLAIPGESPARSTTAALLRMLRHAEPDGQLVLIDALRAIHADARTYPPLVALLRHPDAVHRQLAAALLFDLARPPLPFPDQVTDALVAAVHDPDAPTRGTALRALAQTQQALVVPLAVQALGDGSAEVRRDAAQALAQLGRMAATAGPLLTRLVADPHEPMSVRTDAAWAIGAIGDRSPAALAALSAVLELPHLKLIEQMRDDGREELREAARNALDVLGYPAARPSR